MSPSEQPSTAEPSLVQVLADLQEPEALEIVERRMERGDDPMQILSLIHI